MKKSDSKHQSETPEQELKRLRRENAKLKLKLADVKEADKAKIAELKRELKKKEGPRLRLTDEQCEQLSSLFPGIDFRSK
ncbi:hypothetical protein [Turicimonas muris]|uniref:hypothetical protein n=1 Tax=Turicimonas muris TaxID=1796652 RepID=UPI0026254658|nr:hypothetical protein [Turicimonas muris]